MRGAARWRASRSRRGWARCKTAFRGTRVAKPGPRIAFLCEYDGLPVYGQSCGHNVVAAAGVGAAIGLPRSIGEIGGEVISLGTPGEEGGSGKNVMQREGFFEGIDAMMLIYPGRDNIAHSRALTARGCSSIFREGRARRGAAGARHQRARRDDAGVATALPCCASRCRPTCGCTRIITKGGTLPMSCRSHDGELMVRATITRPAKW